MSKRHADPSKYTVLAAVVLAAFVTATVLAVRLCGGAQ